MKFFFATVLTLSVVIAQSCRKTNPSTGGETLAGERKIRFQLYTDKDFSNENSVIKFSIFIRDAHTTLFDSSLAPMAEKSGIWLLLGLGALASIFGWIVTVCSMAL